MPIQVSILQLEKQKLSKLAQDHPALKCMFGTIAHESELKGKLKKEKKKIRNTVVPPRHQGSSTAQNRQQSAICHSSALCLVLWGNCQLLPAFVFLWKVSLVGSLLSGVIALAAQSEEGAEVMNWVLLPTKTNTSGQKCSSAA